MSEAPQRMESWHSIDETKEDPVCLFIPQPLQKYLGNPKAHKIQTTINIQQFNHWRYRISQRSPEGMLLRALVFDILPDMKNVQLRAYQVLYVKVGEGRRHEELQSAFCDMAKEIVLP